MKRHLLLALFGLLVAPAFLARTALACSCIPPPPPGVALEEADAVFIGEVSKIRNVADRRIRVTLGVAHSYKGTAAQFIEVQTATDSAACGFPFKEGQRYLVYANVYDDVLRASLCSRTARLEDARDDLAILGEPELDFPAPEPRCGGPSNAAALQAMFFIFLSLTLQRRKRR